MTNTLDLSNLTAVEVYRLKQEGRICQFPKGFWDGEEGKENAKCIIKYLIEEIWQWTKEDVCRNISINIFRKNGLGGMMYRIYQNNRYKAIQSVYPDQYKPWEFQITTMGYWNKETAIQATKWMIEEKLGWTNEDVCNNLDKETFENNGLRGMINHVYGGSPYAALNSAYPGLYKPWELKYVPMGYWNEENAIQATKWLIEEKLCWNHEEVSKNISQRTFKQNGLWGMLRCIYGGSPYKALKNAYPDQYNI